MVGDHGMSYITLMMTCPTLRLEHTPHPPKKKEENSEMLFQYLFVLLAVAKHSPIFNAFFLRLI